jgi:hypothetical protein
MRSRLRFPTLPSGSEKSASVYKSSAPGRKTAIRKGETELPEKSDYRLVRFSTDVKSKMYSLSDSNRSASPANFLSNDPRTGHRRNTQLSCGSLLALWPKFCFTHLDLIERGEFINLAFPPNQIPGQVRRPSAPCFARRGRRCGILDRCSSE